MLKAGNLRPAGAIRFAAAIALAGLFGTASAQAEIPTLAGINSPKASEQPNPDTHSAPTYQIRCWQQGRLILDEYDVAMTKDALINTTVLYGRDRRQRPIYVIDMPNATCFVRPTESIPGRSAIPAPIKPSR